MARTKLRTVHRLLGLLLLLPLLAWCVTGVLFHVKPGWSEAYAGLSLDLQPLQDLPPVTPDPEWREVRRLRTVLGDHLLVRTDAGWRYVAGPAVLALARSACTGSMVGTITTWRATLTLDGERLLGCGWAGAAEP